MDADEGSWVWVWWVESTDIPGFLDSAFIILKRESRGVTYNLRRQHNIAYLDPNPAKLGFTYTKNSNPNQENNIMPAKTSGRLHHV